MSSNYKKNGRLNIRQDETSIPTQPSSVEMIHINRQLFTLIEYIT